MEAADVQRRRWPGPLGAAADRIKAAEGDAAGAAMIEAQLKSNRRTR